MRICIKLLGMAGFALALQATVQREPARKIKFIVQADPRSGRLIRSVIVPTAIVSEKALVPAAMMASSTSVETGSVEPQSDQAGTLQQTVEQIAQRHELEPDLVHSVIRVESNYNPYAVSSKGAQGLMQLIPSTARRFGVANTFNPVDNIEGGVRYLKHLLQLYNDNYPLALAAYNAGEGAVARYGGIPPYPETRSYVDQVGKKLGARRAARRTLAPALLKPEPAEEHSRIQKVLDADGSVHYVTR